MLGMESCEHNRENCFDKFEETFELIFDWCFFMFGPTAFLVESNYELMTREPRKNGKKAFYDVFLLYRI